MDVHNNETLYLTYS